MSSKINNGLFSNIKGDFFGGITAGIVALPLALAFGAQTELGAVAGLYGAIGLGILAAIFGGTKTQISGPTAPMTVVSAVMITESLDYAGTIEKAMPFIIATFIITGLLQIIMGVLKLGKYIKYIPYPVVSGFMSGIGIIIIITQIFPFFGITAPDGGAFGTIKSLHSIPEKINLTSTIIAIATVVIIYLMPKITKKVPASLVALVLVSAVAFFLIPDGSFTRIDTEGPIPTGLPRLHFDFVSVFADFGIIVKIVEYAITLAALGAIDSLLTSVVADNMTKENTTATGSLLVRGLAIWERES